MADRFVIDWEASHHTEGDILVVDTQNEGSQPRALTEVIPTMTAGEVESIQRQLQERVATIELAESIQVLNRIPADAKVDLQQDWQNVPQKSHIIYVNGKFGVVIEVAPTKSEHESGKMAVMFKGERTPLTMSYTLVPDTSGGDLGFKCTSGDSVCKFAEPSRLEGLGIKLTKEQAPA